MVLSLDFAGSSMFVSGCKHVLYSTIDREDGEYSVYSGSLIQNAVDATSTITILTVRNFLGSFHE